MAEETFGGEVAVDVLLSSHPGHLLLLRELFWLVVPLANTPYSGSG